MKSVLVSLAIVLSLPTWAAENTPKGQLSDHGEGGTFCDYECKKHAFDLDRGNREVTQAELERKVYCATHPTECSSKEMKGFGYQ